jgi:hypothetical protein
LIVIVNTGGELVIYIYVSQSQAWAGADEEVVLSPIEPAFDLGRDGLW